MACPNSADSDVDWEFARERQEAIVQAYRELVQHPVYLATATTGSAWWSKRTEEILEICILDSDGRVLFESLVKPRGWISFGSYQTHRITQRMVKDAPIWEDIASSVQSPLSGRRVAVFNAKREQNLLKQMNDLCNRAWTLDAPHLVNVHQLYTRFHGRIGATGRNDEWLTLRRAARKCGIPHGKRHRAKEDAQHTRAVLQHIAKHLVVQPPNARLPRVSLIQRWLARFSRCDL